MKKLFFMFSCILTAAAVFASTCETRVDNKWDKTTQERIASCLFPELEAPAPQKQVIVSDVYSVKPSKTKPQQKNVQKASKTYSKQQVYNEYIDDDHYPKFKNEFMPQQSVSQANETAIEAITEQRESANLPVLKATKKPVEKPARQVVSVEELANVPVDGEVYQDNLPDTVSTMQDYQTPPAEIAQAQAMQNDPLNNPYAETYTGEFENGGVMGPADFGYNSTDPAYQQ